MRLRTARLKRIFIAFALLIATPATADPRLNSIADRLDAIAAELRDVKASLLPPIEDVAAELEKPLVVTVDPAEVVPGERSVTVRIRLDRPASYTTRWRACQGNGTIYAPTFIPKDHCETFVLDAGETEHLASFPLVRDWPLGKTSTISVANVGNSLNNKPAAVSARGTVTAVAANPIRAALSPDAGRPVAPGAGKAGKTLAFRTNFTGCVSPRTTGTCLRSQLSGGRYIGNSGSGVLVDDEFAPGSNAMPIVDGKRTLRAMKCPPVTYNGQTFEVCASTLTTQGVAEVRPGDFMEVRLRHDVRAGIEAAVWLLPSGGGWPPEIDVMESCVSMKLPCAISLNQHQRVNGKHSTYRYLTDMAPDEDWHTWALDWSDPATLIWLRDGVEMFREPALIRTPMFLIVSQEPGMGGDRSFIGPSVMTLDYAEIWRASAGPADR